MAILLTNGTYYISLNKNGGVIKVADINKAKDFVSVDSIEITDDENDASDDIVLLEVQEENGEVWLQPVTDETLFNQIATLFQERLNDMFGFEDDL